MHLSMYLSYLHRHVSVADVVADVVLASVVDCGLNQDAEEMDPI